MKKPLAHFLRFMPFAGAIFFAPSLLATSLIHDYELNGNLTDALAGPSLTSLGGTLSGLGYSFGANQGLDLSNGISATNYSIEMMVTIDATSGYRKYLDFKDLSSDNGLYNINGFLNFYNVVTGPSQLVAPGVAAHIVTTRDGSTGLFTGYVDGVAQFSFVDSGGLATFTGLNNVVHFLQDDHVTGQGEASGGYLDFIRIYDGALSSTEVAGLSNGSPVPDSLGYSWMLVLLAMGGLRAVRTSRRV